MKVAIVHDDLVQWGGAERMLVAIAELFPGAPIYTSVFDRGNKELVKQFGSKVVKTSFLQNIPGWKSLYKALLPLYPIAFEQFDFSDYDLVISQTTRFAKSIITKPETRHVCYCHTPPRFLWKFSGENVPKLIQPILSFLRIYDQISASRVDTWIAGSQNAQKRIEKVYKVMSKVAYPFVDLKRFEGIESWDGGYLLTLSRLNSYKRVDLAIEAAQHLKLTLKVVGEGPEKERLMKIADNNVEFLGSVNDQMVVELLAGCKALIVSAEEDFGLTPLEAQALGKPVIAYQSGGALETVIDAKTGYFFNEQSVDSLVEALGKLEEKGYNKDACLENAKSFSKANFLSQFQEVINS